MLIETIPATYGFPLPEPGYLQGVKQLCERYGALYIADEVQTGLMRTGEMWGIAKAGVEPDIMVVGKGITGGMYPIACAVVSEECSAWLKEDGFGHISTGGGAELGCIVGLKVLEICERPEVRSMVHYIADRFGRGLRAIQELYPDWFVGIRQDGVVMGLEFDHPEGAKLVMKHLYENGVWAIFSTLDPRVLQFKPGILLGPELVDEVLDRTEVSIGQALAEARGERVEAAVAMREPAARGRRRAARADDAPARPLGRHGVRRVRPRAHPSDRRRGRRGGIPKREKVCRLGGRGDRHGRGRAQAGQERGLLEGRRRVVGRRRLRQRPGRRRTPASSRSRARPESCSR